MVRKQRHNHSNKHSNVGRCSLTFEIFVDDTPNGGGGDGAKVDGVVRRADARAVRLRSRSRLDRRYERHNNRYFVLVVFVFRVWWTTFDNRSCYSIVVSGDGTFNKFMMDEA